MIDILKDEEEFYETIQGKLFLFFTPFLIAALYIYLLYLIIHDLTIFWIVGGGILTYFFPPAGKESVIPGTIFILQSNYRSLPAYTIIFVVAASIAFVDIVSSYFLLWNFYIAEKIPLIGKWIQNFQDYGAKKMKEKEWIKNLAFLGVAVFVVFPFQGSGGVGGSIFGRVIGMNKYRAWLAIITGSFTGCFVIAILAYYTGNAIIDIFKTDIFAGIGALALVIVAFIFLYHFYKSRLFGEKKVEQK
ncbi:MAG: small multi-drug export protein [Candidatus Thermoplasmatota archaeon]